MLQEKCMSFVQKYMPYIVGTLLVFICCCILYKANWLFMGSLPGDDYQFLMTTAIGKPSHGATWDSRFWPLGLGDYSILLLFPYGATPLAHYIYNCVILLGACRILYLYLCDITSGNQKLSGFMLLILFCSAGFMQIHMECIYPERMILFILCVFMMCVHRAKLSNKIGYYVVALLVAIAATYMKEPVFAIFFTVSFIELVFNRNHSKASKIFNVMLILNSLIFVAIYVYRRLFKPCDRVYASFTPNFSAFDQFLNEPLLFCVIILLVIRSYYFLCRKDRSQVTTDALLLAGYIYSLAYFCLNLTAGYYVLPAIVLSLPALANFLNKCRGATLALVGIFLCAIPNIMHSASLVTNNWKHRQDDYKLFQRIVDEHDKNKKVYWLNLPQCANNDPNYNHSNMIMGHNRFQHFINYYSKNRCLIYPIEDITNILNDKCILICGVATTTTPAFKSIELTLLNKGFDRIADMNGYLVFGKN